MNITHTGSKVRKLWVLYAGVTGGGKNTFSLQCFIVKRESVLMVKKSLFESSAHFRKCKLRILHSPNMSVRLIQYKSALCICPFVSITITTVKIKISSSYFSMV